MAKYDLVTGGGGNENTVDFSLSSDEVYTQGSGNTLNLSVLEALEAALSETITVNDVVTSQADYVKNYQNSLALNDADVRDVGKVLDEVVNVNDLNIKQVEKPVSEDLIADDAVNREADYFRNYNEVFGVDAFTSIKAVLNLFETISLDEADFKQFDKLLVESFSENDVYGRESDYFRVQTENFALNEFFDGVIKRFLNIVESFSLNEQEEIFSIISLFEDLTLNEVYGREADYFRNYSEVFSLNEFESSGVSKIFEENFGVDAFTSITATVNLFEDLKFDDTDTEALGKLLDDGFGVDDSIVSRDVSIFRDERLRIDDADIRDLRRTLQEGLGGRSVFNSQADLFRVYGEQQIMDEALSNFASKPVVESLAADDVRSSRLQKELSQTFSLRSVYVEAVEMFRSYSEVLGTADVLDREYDLFRSYEAGVKADDEQVFALGRSLTEVAGFDEFYSREAEFFRSEVEKFRFKNLVSKQLERAIAGNLALDERFEDELVVFRNLGEIFHFEDSIAQRRMFKSLQQSFILDDEFGREADFFREYSEGFALDGARSSKIGRQINEAFSLDEVSGVTKVLFRQFEEAFAVNDSLKSNRTFRRVLNEVVDLDDEFDFFFSEGPGTPPYFVRNSFVQGNSVQNEYITKTIQNLFESLNVENSFGDREQT